MSFHLLASSAIRDELIKRSTATTAAKIITYNAISRMLQRLTSCILVSTWTAVIVGNHKWQNVYQKHQGTVRCLLFLAKKYAFLSLGMRIKQWHATSVYQPVAGVQIVGKAQKDLNRKNREGVASFLPFYFPRSLTTPLSERLHFLRAFPPVNGLNNLVISSNITCCVFRICNEKTESLKLLAPMKDLVTNLKVAEDDSKCRYRNILFV